MAPPRSVPTIDLNPFFENAHPQQRLAAGQALVKALRDFGFVKITGHGFTRTEIDDAFKWAQRLFALPVEDKLKAPHPAGPMPHRGYSGLGMEKVYSRADEAGVVDRDGADVGRELRKVSDYKVSSSLPPLPFLPWVLV